MTVLLFANGILDDRQWIEPYFADATAVLAADGGLHHVMALGRLPDVVIGDMDSIAPVREGDLIDDGVQLAKFSHDKDETDLELALAYAVENYDAPIRIFGAIGGRLDHTLANISLLANPMLQGRDVRLEEPNEEVWLVSDRTHILGEAGDIVSLLPLGADAHIAETTGLRWPLQDETLAFGGARGVSNEMTGSLATVEVASGQLLCIHRRP